MTTDDICVAHTFVVFGHPVADEWGGGEVTPSWHDPCGDTTPTTTIHHRPRQPPSWPTSSPLASPCTASASRGPPATTTFESALQPAAAVRLTHRVWQDRSTEPADTCRRVPPMCQESHVQSTSARQSILRQPADHSRNPFIENEAIKRNRENYKRRNKTCVPGSASARPRTPLRANPAPRSTFCRGQQWLPSGAALDRPA